MPTWFELQTPKDLLQKLRADCQRLQDEPADSYAAFDFFVTAWHLLEWKYPGRNNKDTRRRIVDGSSLLRICEHVANGVKHFELGNPRLQSVTHAGTTGAFSRDFNHSFDRVRLVVHLEDQAKLDFGAMVEVSQLACKIVKWWESEIAS